jgi:NAD(P)-dependent dehydrogenase (short-subunit alcohol dehydrogenase family)
VLIHNAGNSLFAPLDEITYEQFRSVVDIHLLGGFHVVRPAFPLMKKAGYGRVVLTGSIGGLYGMPTVVGYSVAKAGMIGLNNMIAIEGADHGVKSNIILPAAHTRMADGIDTSQMPPMTPEQVAPVVGWLAHESCSITGEMLASVAGRVARALVAETPGVYRPDWTIDTVGDNIAAIRDQSELWTLNQLTGFNDHLGRSFEMAVKG